MKGHIAFIPSSFSLTVVIGKRAFRVLRSYPRHGWMWVRGRFWRCVRVDWRKRILPIAMGLLSLADPNSGDCRRCQLLRYPKSWVSAPKHEEKKSHPWWTFPPRTRARRCPAREGASKRKSLPCLSTSVCERATRSRWRVAVRSGL